MHGTTLKATWGRDTGRSSSSDRNPAQDERLEMEDEMNAEGDKTELLGFMKEVTRRNMPDTMTFFPHARIYSEKTRDW